MFSTLDTHVEGEAFRIVIQSSIHLNENDIHLNHKLLQESYQKEKDFLLKEPRGHQGMNGCIVIPSKLADYGLLFFNHDKQVSFQYGGLVASITALLETGNLTANEQGIYKIETVCGIYTVRAAFDNQEVSSVYIESDESKVVEKREEYQLVEIEKNRNYLVFPLPDSIPGINLAYLSAINKWGKAMAKRLSTEKIRFDGIVIAEELDSSKNELRSVTFERDGNMIRSPGIDSTFAILTAQRLIKNKYKALKNDSIFGSSISVQHLPGSYNRYSVTLQGFTTGLHQFILDEDDPLRKGFLLV